MLKESIKISQVYIWMTEFLLLISTRLKHQYFTIHYEGNYVMGNKIGIILGKKKKRKRYYRFHYWIFFWFVTEMKFQTKVAESQDDGSMPDELLPGLKWRWTVFLSSVLWLLTNKTPNLKKWCPNYAKIGCFSIGLVSRMLDMTSSMRAVFWLSSVMWGRCNKRWAWFFELRMTGFKYCLMRKRPQIFRAIKGCMTKARQ